jgi:hypothetical protein
MINFEELTLGEIEEIEMLVGRGIDVVFADGQPKGRALRVLYFIAQRRENPKYKFEDTEKITQAEALKVLGGSDPKEQSS